VPTTIKDANNIRLALERSGGKIYGSGGAAELLEVKPTTLASRIETLGIDPKAEAQHASLHDNPIDASRFGEA
jgi:transcriptional regulator with GAF, ATPase, and Fis domain